MQTATTTVDDLETIETTPSSDSASQAGSREAMGAALLRLSGDEVPTSPPPSRERVNDAGEDASGHAAPIEATSNPDEDESDDPLPRRAASSIRELRAEVERLKAQLTSGPPATTAASPAAAAEPEQDPLDAAEQAARETVDALRGSDADWADLQARVVDGLSFEDAERYRTMRAARVFEQEWQTLADVRTDRRLDQYRRSFFREMAGHFDAVAQKPGVDADALRTAGDLGAVFAHVYEAGRKDLSDENERLKGELAEARARLAGAAPRLPTGGRSSLSVTGTPDPRNADPQELMRSGMRNRDRRAAGRR